MEITSAPDGEVSLTEAVADGVLGAAVGRNAGAAGEHVAKNTSAGKAKELQTQVRCTTIGQKTELKLLLMEEDLDQHKLKLLGKPKVPRLPKELAWRGVGLQEALLM